MIALPQHEFGLDVIALIGTLRHAGHRSVPEIHAELIRRGVAICVRSVASCWTATTSCGRSRCPIRPGSAASPRRPAG